MTVKDLQAVNPVKALKPVQPLQPVHRRSRRGFTLLEVALVLAVLAILATLALPSLGYRLERQRVLTAAQTLAGDLSEARFEAARRGAPLFVQTRTGADWCWAVATTPECDCGGAVPQACALHVQRASSHRGVRLPEGLALRLEAVGGAEGTRRTALLETTRGEQLRVEVSTLGRARVCALRGTWPQTPAC